MTNGDVAGSHLQSGGGRIEVADTGSEEVDGQQRVEDAVDAAGAPHCAAQL